VIDQLRAAAKALTEGDPEPFASLFNELATRPPDADVVLD
jgi:hypothetical protein